jgi:hypothetical protein
MNIILYEESVADKTIHDDLDKEGYGSGRVPLAFAAVIIVCLVFIAALFGCSANGSGVGTADVAGTQLPASQSDTQNTQESKNVENTKETQGAQNAQGTEGDQATTSEDGSQASGFVMEDSSTVTVQIDE